jgi:hypothetical protein
MLRRSVVFLCVFSLLCASAAVASAVSYTVADLGVLGSYTMSVAMGVNSSGVVTGFSNNAITLGGHAFTATGGPPMTDIHPFLLGGANSGGLGISDTGLVACLAGAPTAPTSRAAIYNSGTTAKTRAIAPSWVV